ncbi:hypothetical protein A2783_04205 [Microgenomates group bacterium RIFCSPHIGHO2_01_FULL_45_11]|nr:MAG: hypothetical protein A2783_04205 [Microgenomates group bacterium RIFCSPHIGHO2_01_FULL_45_11]
MKQDFNYYLDTIGEVGEVSQILHVIVNIRGLPEIRSQEMVIFESGDLGQVLSFSKDSAEVLLLTPGAVRVGMRVARTNQDIQISVGKNVLGKTINPLGVVVSSDAPLRSTKETRSLDAFPLGINRRHLITESLETGVSLVDLVIPLGRGQRQLVMGDRKTGKTQFLLQILLTQAQKGSICIYAAIAKRRADILDFQAFFKSHHIDKQVILIASASSDPAGLIHLTPYTAMTYAEYFRDTGENVVIILDDLTAHAKYYREISLLARRFPGRSSYPGDIFYLHAKLLERAGNFTITEPNQPTKTVSITCFPVSELVMGDITGYVQTNLMAMTDGHILFDINFFNQGRRPAINPFLSVTRVGRQAQTPLMRDLSRQLTSFLVKVDNLRQFMHFGAELSERSKKMLSLGEKLEVFFGQPSDKIISVNINIFLVSALWAGFWQGNTLPEMKQDMNNLASLYTKNSAIKTRVDALIMGSQSFTELVKKVSAEITFISNLIKSGGAKP